MKLPPVGLALLSKSFIEVRGRDAAKFLNGLVTSRFMPTIEKKLQYTITDSDSNHSELQDIIQVDKNWGLMHEDIYDPEKNIYIGRDGINSMFLNAKGRIITDCFIYSNPFNVSSTDEASYLIEVDTQTKSKLMTILKLHKLGSKIKINLPDLKSYYYYNDSDNFDQFLNRLQSVFFSSRTPIEAQENASSLIDQDVIFNKSINLVGFAIDNRIPNFGIKFVTENLGEKAFSSDFPFKEEIVPESTITKRRFINGLFEVNDAPKDMALLPFDTNLDYTNGLSLEKGCYMGQELTIRTFNNGTIRKRVLPVEFYKLNESDEEIEDVLKSASLEDLQITPIEETTTETTETDTAHSPFGDSSKPVRRRNTSSGKIISIHENHGFVLINLSHVNANKFYKTKITSENGSEREIGVKVEIPNWWPVD